MNKSKPKPMKFANDISNYQDKTLWFYPFKVKYIQYIRRVTYCHALMSNYDITYILH